MPLSLQPKSPRTPPRFLLVLMCMLPIGAAAPSAYGIMAGALPDTPAARVDPNTTSSTWAGVGSLIVNGGVYSATVIDKRHVLTAGHVALGANPASVTFNLNFGSDLSHQIPAAAVFPHPQFQGFDTPNLQHDIAIVELSQDIPAGVPIYPMYFQTLAAGSTLTLVGYGASGNGDMGATVGGSASVKRVGKNNADGFELDVDGSGRNALFEYDFDGVGATSFLGNSGLGNSIETSVAGGDSGSPSFVSVSGKWQLAGVNTFTFSVPGGPTNPSTFGTGGGGNLVYPYQTWITSILTRPPNDTFANRATLAGATGTASATNVGATKQSGEPDHAGNAGGTSVWWKWVAPQSGPAAFNTHGSGFDTLLAVYTGGSVTALSPVASNDNDGSMGNASGVAFQAQAGTEYEIVVDGFNGASGAVALQWSSTNTGISANVPTLPAWGVTVMGLLLAATAATSKRRTGRQSHALTHFLQILRVMRLRIILSPDGNELVGEVLPGTRPHRGH